MGAQGRPARRSGTCDAFQRATIETEPAQVTAMSDEYEFLMVLCDEADEEVRDQIRLICEGPWDAPGAASLAAGHALPRRPETCRHSAH